MPGRDGTGPLGQGPMTGRNLGVCSGVNNASYGRVRGLYCRRTNSVYMNIDSKANLMEEKSILEARLEAVNNQLNK